MTSRFGLHDQAGDGDADFVSEGAQTIRPEVGRAYLCVDGVVRWCYGRTASGGLRVRWYSRKADGWFGGETIPRGRIADFPAVAEVPAPTPGDVFVLYSAQGVRTEWIVPTPPGGGR